MATASDDDPDQRPEHRDAGTLPEDEGYQDDLRHRVHLGHPEGVYRHWVAKNIGKQHGADDEEIAADDEHDQPGRQFALESEGHEDGDEQRLVGDRVEIGAELGGGPEPLGDEAVSGVGKAGEDEQHRRRQIPVRDHQPNDKRNADQAGNGDEVR